MSLPPRNDPTGGPAFPSPGQLEQNPFSHFPQLVSRGGASGMSLRDYFAAEAIAPEIARWPDGHPNGWDGIAAGCYAVADAMLKARAS